MNYYTRDFERRLYRQKEFFAKKETKGALIFRKAPLVNFEGFILKKLESISLSQLTDKDTITAVIDEFLEGFRSGYHNLYLADDDMLPVIEIYIGIGAITAAMANMDPRFFSGTSWCDPVSDDRDILDSIKFNPDHEVIRFSIMAYKELIRRYEGDFAVIPFFYRSPLDAANGLRGNALFYDMYDNPDKVVDLADRCADWCLDMEDFILQNTGIPDSMERGSWGAYIPKTAVFVNGDPADLISREFQRKFERPSTEKLFTSTGGGFFHHHALGLYQADQIAMTSGMFIHEIFPDPNVPDVCLEMIGHEDICSRMIGASLKVPIMLDVPSNLIMELLPLIKEGRFILRLADDGIANEVIQAR